MTTDPREPYGRIVRETWVAWAKEQESPKPGWLTGWDELDAGQREVGERIGSAVAARAVADAGGELASARTERTLMRLWLAALESYLPAALDALSTAVAGSEYEHQKRRYEAARIAFEALEAGTGEGLTGLRRRADAMERSRERAIAEAVATERERIRQLAIRSNAICAGDEGTNCFFSDLIGEPQGRSDGKESP